MHSRIVVAPLALCLGLFSALAGLAQGPGGLLPDVRGAERELIRARDELEEIAGDRLGEEVPALPVVDEEALSLSEEERARVERLFAAEPEAWTDQDRRWVRELLPLDLALRGMLAGGERDDREKEGPEAAELAEESEVIVPEELARRSLVLLRAVQVVALGDRLADLDGDLSALLDGIELRDGVAERLFLQPGLIGSVIASTIHLEALRDLRRALERTEVSRETLDRIDLLLLRWRQAVPSAAQVVAMEGLSILERTEHLPGVLGVVAEPAAVHLVAPVARDFAEVARICEESGCAHAAAFLDRHREESDNPFRVIADMMTPDILALATKLDGVARLTEVAHVAVALRLEGLEMGGYPATPEELPAVLAARIDDIEGLEFERVEGGVRLRLPSRKLLSQWPEARRPRLEPLFVWELPALPATPTEL